MARSAVARKLVALGGDPAYREGVITDNGNVILDVFNLNILNPIELEQTINNIPGVVTNAIPEIEMVRHARAKRLKLVVSAKGVRLTIPPYATQQQINVFVQQHRPWIAETWAKLQYSLQHKSQAQTLPDTLQFSYLDKLFKVHYQDLDKHLFVLHPEPDNTLYIHEKYAEYALTQFTIKMAKQVLSKHTDNTLGKL
ncbi:hypothetical protein GWI33_010946 [Rhynchophorus ferrugineus]|uniref:YgjP-like metallopeptidase domain-containing protein n=1 Tax=Rhynchophorus ferrugineus TaxID=354439 RepID=A0A834ICI0_RHYFE|nr:hypothetical protein GWI33_010946 [Rhynchophorus ferrugineus]